jgi:hypothetical protein
MPFATTCLAATADTQANIKTLETMVARLECSLKEHAQELASCLTAASSTQPAVYIQNFIIATIHRTRTAIAGGAQGGKIGGEIKSLLRATRSPGQSVKSLLRTCLKIIISHPTIV